MAYCQQKGKKILISIGGDSPGNQLTSKDAATSFANQLWQIFGPKPSGFTGPRPFGDNVVDGFDLDIESGDGKFVPDLAHSLSSLTASDKSKRYYLTAAPQCPIPDARLYAALTAAPFDHVFVSPNFAHYSRIVSKCSDKFRRWKQIARTHYQHIF